MLLYGVPLFALSFCLLLSLAITWRVSTHATSAAVHCETKAITLCVKELTEAARWYIPLVPYWEQAANLALQFIAAGDFTNDERKDLYWRLRAAIYESRSFLRSEKHGKQSEVLTKIDELLEFNVNAMPIKRVGEKEPNFFWQVTGQLCFFAWILFVAAAIFKGMSKTGSIQAKPFLTFLAAAIVAFISWLFCLSFA